MARWRVSLVCVVTTGWCYIICEYYTNKQELQVTTGFQSMLGWKVKRNEWHLGLHRCEVQGT